TGSVSWWGVTQIVFFALLGLSWLVWLPSQVGRYRRATGVRRQQLKWLISGASATIIGLPITISFSSTSTTLGRIVEGIGSAGLTVAAFSASLRDAIDLNRIERELVDVVQRAIEPSLVSVWLRPGM